MSELYIVIAGSFSVGFSFHYDDMFRPYSVCNNFKEEILNYADFDISTFKNEVMIKVDKYHETNMAKSMVSRYYTDPPNTIINKQHMIAVVLYTDYTKLSSKFSASFRRLKQKNK